MEIPRAHWIQWTKLIPVDISRSIGSIGSIAHFRLAISMAYYLHDVRHMLVITLFKDILIDQLKKQMSLSYVLLYVRIGQNRLSDI
jgi:hypothetical protein